MAKLTIKTGTWYVLLLLVVLLALLPILKGTSSLQGFTNPNYPATCNPVCGEGHFCAKEPNTCLRIGTRYPDAVPTGNF